VALSYSGNVRVERGGKFLNKLKAGACFGDWGVVNQQPRAASCIADGGGGTLRATPFLPFLRQFSI
jgi:hypothetical protein